MRLIREPTKNKRREQLIRGFIKDARPMPRPRPGSVRTVPVGRNTVKRRRTRSNPPRYLL